MLSRQPGHSKQSAEIDSSAAIVVSPTLSPSRERSSNESKIIIIFVCSNLFLGFGGIDVGQLRRYGNAQRIEKEVALRLPGQANIYKLGNSLRLSFESLRFSGEFDQDDTRYIYYGIFIIIKHFFFSFD